jgi:hypothetical protein
LALFVSRLLLLRAHDDGAVTVRTEGAGASRGSIAALASPCRPRLHHRLGPLVQEGVHGGPERGKCRGRGGRRRAGGVDKSGADGVVVPEAAEHGGEDERRDGVVRV